MKVHVVVRIRIFKNIITCEFTSIYQRKRVPSDVDIRVSNSLQMQG